MAEKALFDFHGYIQGCIQEIEKKYNIIVVLAVESGSRMWGFPSEDSDYDVRFLYVHNDVRDTFVVDERDDTISFQDANPLIDCHGWEIQKAISLMVRGNGSVMDWLSSPIVYKEDSRIKALIGMLQHYLLSSPNISRRLAHHHRGLCKRLYMEALAKDQLSKFKIKDALYCVRSTLLMCRLYQYEDYPTGVLPKVTIRDLLDTSARSDWKLSDDLVHQTNLLISRKIRAKKEKDCAINLTEWSSVHGFITENMDFSLPAAGDRDPRCTDAANATLRAILSW